MLRLGLVGPLPPPNGGMAMQTLQLARLLREEGIEVTLLATNAPYKPAFVAGITGLRALFRLVPYLVAVWRLAGRVELIHLMANSGWSWQLYSSPVLWLARLRNTPVVVNYRGGEAKSYFQRSYRWVRPSMRKAALVVVPSQYLQTIFKEFGQETLVISNIIDLDLFRPNAFRNRDSSDNAQATTQSFTLVITRNLEPIYGIDSALRALSLVLFSGYPVKLRIAGSGPAEVDLKGLVQDLGIENAVTFEGRLDRNGIAALYADADAMLNPATVDNMPNSVLEAMACGLPVISTDVGGVPYILQHEETGLLVPSNDHYELANAIVRLCTDAKLWKHLRANGLSQVKQYTWSNVRGQWLAAYNDACSGSRKMMG